MREQAPGLGACPDLAELLLASEGELPKRRLDAVREHVRRCGSCRARLGDAAASIDAYGETVAATPPTSSEIVARAARDERFHRRLRDEVQATREAHERKASAWTAGTTRRWLPFAAAVPVLVLGLLFSSRYTSTLKADELLTRAVEQQQTEPKATVRRVEIRFNPSTTSSATVPQRVSAGSTTITREVGAAPFVSVQKPAPAERTLAALFAAHHFDLDDPLSVAHFQAWRASLARKKDDVRSQQGDRLVALKTVTDDGALKSAEIIIRRADYHAVRQTLAFEDVGEVEIAEVASWVVNTPRSAPSIEPPSPAPRVARAAPEPSALDDAELDARKVLHDASVDVDGRLDIRRSSRTVLVRGAVPAATIANLRARLAAIDLVTPEIRAASAEPPSSSSSAASPSPDTPAARDAAALAAAGLRAAPDDVAGGGGGAVTSMPLASWRARTFPRPADAAAFIASLEQHVDVLRGRAEAYQALAVRYADRDEQQLAPASRQKLQDLIAAHHRDILRALDTIDSELALFLGTSTRTMLAEQVDDKWRDQAAGASLAARQLHEALTRLLRQDDVPLPTELNGRDEPVALRDVRRASNQLWQLFERPGHRD